MSNAGSCNAGLSVDRLVVVFSPPLLLSPLVAASQESTLREYPESTTPHQLQQVQLT
jgi:hypothetical protein